MADRTARVLSASERLYLLMVELYPKEFRLEFAHEMAQSFRDRSREELSRGGIWALLPVWAETALDLTATVSIEHLKRRKTMDAIEKNLCWDLRYGLQKFLRHSGLVLRYGIGGSLVLLMAAILGSLVYVEYKQVRVNTMWKETTGETPDNLYQSVLSSFPQGPDNTTTQEIKAIGERLGIFPVTGVKEEMTPGWCGGVFDVPPYLKAQLQNDTDDVAEPPTDIKAYLRDHAEDLSQLQDLVLRAEAPRWETNFSLLGAAPVPNLRSLLRLHSAIALNSLQESRLGKSHEALKRLDISWKINESLRARPDLMSQQIAMAVLNLQAGVLRKIKEIPSEWEQRIAAIDLQEPVLTALKFDAVIFSRQFGEPEIQRVADSFSWTGVGRQFRRVIAVWSLEVAGKAVGRLKLSNGCSFDPDRFQEEIENSLPSFAKMGISVGSARLWKTVGWTRMNLELTQRVLQLRRLQAGLGERSRLVAPTMVSSLCRDIKWEHQIMADGAVLVSCSWFPSWVQQENGLGLLPIRYTLKTESQHHL